MYFEILIQNDFFCNVKYILVIVEQQNLFHFPWFSIRHKTESNQAQRINRILPTIRWLTP